MDLVSPVTQSVYARIDDASPARIDAQTEVGYAAFLADRACTAAERASRLANAAHEVEAAHDDLVGLLINDIGKPRRLAAAEVKRSAEFVRACASEIPRICGETLPLDAVRAGAGHFGFTRRVPFGLVAAITPFNAPVNLLVQKLAPALAAGNAVLVKPHPAGTRVALRVARAFVEAGVPSGLVDIVTGDRDAALALASHRRVTAVTFTGGPEAGAAVVRAAGAKKFAAELGANSANVVLADADLGDAAIRIAAAGFEASGQQCISAQRVIVADCVYDDFLPLFVTAARALKVGDPASAETDIGPMISASAAQRSMDLVADALRLGGRLALEPIRNGCTVSPAIVIDAPTTAKIWCEEAFGPIVVVQRATDAEHALHLANDSPFGLQGSVFTRSLKWAMRFAQDLDVGAVWVNEASRFRLDLYPFGGSKGSGFGREGVRYAIEELSQLKFIGIRFDV